MKKLRSASKQARAKELFALADRKGDEGDYVSAMQLYHAAAKAGDTGALANIGYLYDQGLGVARDQDAALLWYLRAYRRGESIGAHNIGTIWRDEGHPRRALAWFRRAVKMGNDSSNIEIAKIYLQTEGDPARAIEHLEKVCGSDSVSEANAETGARLLRRARKQLAARQRACDSPRKPAPRPLVH